MKRFGAEYKAHRVTQAFELSQFVKLTSESCDFVIVAGDFNLQPHDVSYQVVTANGNLQDAWVTQVTYELAVTAEH